MENLISYGSNKMIFWHKGVDDKINSTVGDDFSVNESKQHIL